MRTLFLTATDLLDIQWHRFPRVICNSATNRVSPEPKSNWRKNRRSSATCLPSTACPSELAEIESVRPSGPDDRRRRPEAVIRHHRQACPPATSPRSPVCRWKTAGQARDRLCVACRRHPKNIGHINNWPTYVELDDAPYCAKRKKGRLRSEPKHHRHKHADVNTTARAVDGGENKDLRNRPRRLHSVDGLPSTFARAVWWDSISTGSAHRRWRPCRDRSRSVLDQPACDIGGQARSPAGLLRTPRDHLHPRPATTTTALPCPHQEEHPPNAPHPLPNRTDHPVHPANTTHSKHARDRQLLQFDDPILGMITTCSSSAPDARRTVHMQHRKRSTPNPVSTGQGPYRSTASTGGADGIRTRDTHTASVVRKGH